MKFVISNKPEIIYVPNYIIFAIGGSDSMKGKKWADLLEAFSSLVNQIRNTEFS